ncbi:MAG: signal peptide peptidase SppA [Kiritimatiellia bacterium]
MESNLQPLVSEKEQRKKGCCLGMALGCGTSLFLLLLITIGLPLGLFFGFGKLIKTHIQDEVSTKLSTNDYTTLRGEGTRPVLRLTLNGVITGASDSRWYTTPDGDAAVLTAIEAATDEDYFDAILLVIDSPGGGVTPSDRLYHALECFKTSKTGRKVFVLGGDIVASGAYYTALQADWIRIHPTTIIGSIGVIVPGFNAALLAQKLGIADNSITSGASKDLGNPLKPINPEHNAILKSVVDAMYERFIGLVAKGRQLPIEAVRKLADGRVYSAEDAINLHLADDIGYEDSYDAKIAELMKCDSIDDLIIKEPSSYHLKSWQMFLSEFPHAVGRTLVAPLTETAPRQPEYRY